MDIFERRAVVAKTWYTLFKLKIRYGESFIANRDIYNTIVCRYY